MGSAENPPLYALLAVLALMATFFSPSRLVAGIAFSVGALSAIGAIAAAHGHRASAPRMVLLTCLVSAIVLLALLILLYTTFFVHWTF
jgi:hypothetical protein